jgi:hypothetical protein
MASKKKNDAMAKQEVNSPLIITVGIISVLLLVISAVGLEAWFRYEEEAEMDEKWRENPNVWLAEVRQQELTKLNGGYHWVDKSKNTVAIPLDDAMRIVAANDTGKTR